MDENYIENLLSALENERNSSIMDLTNSKIKCQKNNILQQLQLPREKLKIFHKKLKQYRYCSEFRDIQYGYYIRWISLKDPTHIKITNGAVVCDIKSINGECYILCKNFMNRFFHFKYDENLIFKKLSHQEKIILKVLDFLESH